MKVYADTIDDSPDEMGRLLIQKKSRRARTTNCKLWHLNRVRLLVYPSRLSNLTSDRLNDSYLGIPRD
jgi:hypothetical protein